MTGTRVEWTLSAYLRKLNVSISNGPVTGPAGNHVSVPSPASSPQSVPNSQGSFTTFDASPTVGGSKASATLADSLPSAYTVPTSSFPLFLAALTRDLPVAPSVHHQVRLLTRVGSVLAAMVRTADEAAKGTVESVASSPGGEVTALPFAVATTPTADRSEPARAREVRSQIVWPDWLKTIVSTVVPLLLDTLLQHDEWVEPASFAHQYASALPRLGFVCCVWSSSCFPSISSIHRALTEVCCGAPDRRRIKQFCAILRVRVKKR
jgi:hypothetical protein